MMKKILVPVDSSKYSNEAVQYACSIAQKFNSELTLLHVIPDILSDGDAGFIDYKPLEEAARKKIDAAKEIVASNGLSASTRMESGPTADTIINIAEEEAADLIVIGSRGLSTAKRFLLGSVSNSVSHHTPCPVLIVR
jgi:nucleotide-binding universal stress UspA family protein